MRLEQELLAGMDASREDRGFLTLREMASLAKDNFIPDIFSVLVSKGVKIGVDNTICPCVTIICTETGVAEIGNQNVFNSGTVILAETGPISIGSGNQFGEGGFVAKANRAGARIRIGDGGRYQGGVSIFGETDLETGSQVLGAISLDSCVLAAGGTFREPNPDRRGALLKGYGSARNLRLSVGEVILGNGSFVAAEVKKQSFFHVKS